MSSLSSLMSVARDALTANQGALDIVGKNITNANVPGFSRRTALIENQVFGRGGPGSVLFKGPQRMFDRFAESRLLGESSLLGAARLRSEGLMGLEAMLAPQGSGSLGGRMGAFFGAATDLTTGANDPTKRAQFLARAEEVAQSFRIAADGLNARRSDLQQQAVDVTKEVNSRAKEIAELNGKIAEATALGDPVPDLHDRRDLLVREVAERAPVAVVRESNGTVSVSAAGASLVSGKDSSTLSATLDAQGKLKFEMQRGNGSPLDITSRMTSGELGGIAEARDSDVAGMVTELDQLAFDFASAINTAHAAGFGLDGGTGRPLFTPPAAVAGAAATMSVSALVQGQPDRVAASASAAELPGGSGNALLLASLSSASLGAGGSPGARFGALAGKLGTLQNSASNAQSLREDTVSMAETMREQASGVSIEEEMVDLTRYQRAFEASMKVLRVADELLEGLIRGV